MGDYGRVKKGKLKLKGVKDISNKSGASSGSRKRKLQQQSLADSDTTEHGGWWEITEESETKAVPIAIELGVNCYLMSMDNGRFTVGPPHTSGQEPSPEEVLTLIKTPDSSWLGLKSGYGKYVGVNSQGMMVATSDAIGNREKWELVFQEGKTALQATGNGCFLTCETDKEGYIYASAKIARGNEMIKVRTNAEKDGPVDFTPDEDRKASKDCEVAYVKKFQHSKVNLNPNTAKEVKVAKAGGNLHEVLLDRFLHQNDWTALLYQGYRLVVPCLEEQV